MKATRKTKHSSGQLSEAYSIIGEAVTQLLKLEPDVILTSARQITGFRNVLIHNYARVSQAVIWEIIQENLPVLKAEVMEMLEAA